MSFHGRLKAYLMRALVAKAFENGWRFSSNKLRDKIVKVAVRNTMRGITAHEIDWPTQGVTNVHGNDVTQQAIAYMQDFVEGRRLAFPAITGFTNPRWLTSELTKEGEKGKEAREELAAQVRSSPRPQNAALSYTQRTRALEWRVPPTES